MTNRLEELKKEAQKTLPCPANGCDNNGTIAARSSDGDWEPEPCEFCWRRDDLITHIYTQAIQDAMKTLPEETIIHEYMPHQNTPENNAWNTYRAEAITNLKALLPQQ